MLNRTSESIITFHHTFSIGTAISDHPGGSFRVVKEEELIEGLSFAAYRAVSISVQMPAIGAPGTMLQFIAVSGQDLDAALDADSQMLSREVAPAPDHTVSIHPLAGAEEPSMLPSKATQPL